MFSTVPNLDKIKKLPHILNIVAEHNMGTLLSVEELYGFTIIRILFHRSS